MSGQEIAVAAAGLAALSYIGLRLWRRHGGNCCGERECPAAKQVTQRLGQLRNDKPPLRP